MIKSLAEISKEYFKLDDLHHTGFCGYVEQQLKARLEELEKIIEPKERTIQDIHNNGSRCEISGRIAQIKEMLGEKLK